MIDGETIAQLMVFPDGPLKGEAKGLKVDLAERYGEDFVKGKLLDELNETMSNEIDLKMKKHFWRRNVRRGEIY